jgi:cellulose biosynthesis protein BcsQ
MSYKKKQKKIAVYSEKGGVGKTTIITSIAYKICNIENAIFLDADSSSQSLSDVLKFYQLNPKIIYRDNICVLPFLSEIHNNTEFFFVDLAGREASLTEIEYFKY